MRRFLILFTAGLLLFSQFTLATEVMSVNGNRLVSNFAHAKKVLPKIYEGHNETIYCGCKVYGKEVNMNSCGASSPGQSSRYKKMEWEHVVPAERLGQVVKSWGNGDSVCKGKKGRKCAEKASPLFRQMEGDLYNLWPESGGINAARSNKPPVERFSGKVTKFGSCETVVGKKGFIPRKSVRGEIARTYFYMAEAYGLQLSESEKKMFSDWSQKDPVTPWECERGRRIKKVQGNSNPVLEKACSKAGL